MSDEMEVVRSHMKVLPVDIFGLISDLGIECSFEPMPGHTSGAIEYIAGRYRISVNQSEGDQRRRFTAAHELAHYLLHRDLLDDKGKLNRHSDILFGEAASANVSAPFSPSHEVQANRFAAELLMPRAQIAARYRADVDNVVELARAFHVSEKAMKIRLKTLGLRRSLR